MFSIILSTMKESKHILNNFTCLELSPSSTMVLIPITAILPSEYLRLIPKTRWNLCLLRVILFLSCFSFLWLLLVSSLTLKAVIQVKTVANHLNYTLELQ